jgi:hypothetical protein
VKSYVLLLGVSVPLFLAGYGYFNALWSGTATTAAVRTAFTAANAYSKATPKAVKQFNEVNDKLRLAALGAEAFPPDLPKPKTGPEDQLQRGFERYDMALKAVGKFTHAFADHEPLKAKDLVGVRKAKVLQDWLEKRSEPELKKTEDDLDEMIKDGNLGTDFQKKLIAYSRLPVSDTSRLLFTPPGPPDWKDFAQRGTGTLLVLVIKTKGLLARGNTERITAVFNGLREKKSLLVGGEFVLLTNADDPKFRARPWPARWPANPSDADAFAPSTEPRVVFNKALDFAREIKGLRKPDAPAMGPVELVWVYGLDAPRSGESERLRGLDLFDVYLKWIGPVDVRDPRTKLGDLVPWFADSVSPFHENSSDWPKMLQDQLVEDGSR